MGLSEFRRGFHGARPAQGAAGGALSGVLLGWATVAKFQYEIYRFAGLELSAGMVVAGYLAAGALIGALAGLARPFVSSIAHAALAGLCIGTPVIGMGFYLASVGRPDMSPLGAWAFVGGAVIGTGTGVGLYLIYRDD